MSKNLSKLLRSTSPDTEKIMWELLRNRRLINYKFRRQVNLGPYIVDFVCLKHGLIVELDGSQHNDDTNQMKDAVRTKWLEIQGFKVIRFWNHELMENRNNVLEKIINVITTLPGDYPGRKKY